MADFSCYITITNLTGATMVLQGTPNADHGSYITNPATSIPNGSSTTFQIQQMNFLSPGPQGSCVYAAIDYSGNQGLLQFSYSCPLTTANGADAIVASGSNRFVFQMIPNPLPQYGHPIWAQFTIRSN